MQGQKGVTSFWNARMESYRVVLYWLCAYHRIYKIMFLKTREARIGVFVHHLSLETPFK
jgi:hypothetical protein